MTDQLPEIKPASTSHKTALRGMLFAFFGFFFFSCQDIFMSINTRIYPSLELTWFNCVMTLATLIAVLLIRKGWRGLKVVLYTDHLKIHLIRGSLLAIGTVLVFIAIKDVPLPNFYTIIFIGPLLAVSLSGIFLKEPIGFAKMIALLTGFIGLIIALHPGDEGFNTHSIYVLIAACLFGSTALLGRFLGRKDTALSLIFYPVTLLVVFFSIPVAIEFQPIAAAHLPQVIVTGVFTTLAFFCNAHGYKMAPIYLIAPCQFLQFFWGSIAHAIINHKLPEITVVMGAICIILSNALIIYLQSRQQKKEMI
jgi:drug/metabolite transporter (DMT)-like permease